MTLEEILQAEAWRLVRKSWVPNTNNEIIAMRVGDYCAMLRKAGISTIEIKAEWKKRYEEYKAAGGRAYWRELKGYGW